MRTQPQLTPWVQPVGPWAEDPGHPHPDSWSTETEITNVCGFKPVNLWWLAKNRKQIHPCSPFWTPFYPASRITESLFGQLYLPKSTSWIPPPLASVTGTRWADMWPNWPRVQPRTLVWWLGEKTLSPSGQCRVGRNEQPLPQRKQPELEAGRLRITAL